MTFTGILFRSQTENGESSPVGISSQQTISVESNAPGVAWEHMYSGFPAIDMTGHKIGSQIFFRLYRDPGQDSYESNAAVATFGYHYQTDTMGSRQEGLK